MRFTPSCSNAKRDSCATASVIYPLPQWLVRSQYPISTIGTSQRIRWMPQFPTNVSVPFRYRLKWNCSRARNFAAASRHHFSVASTSGVGTAQGIQRPTSSTDSRTATFTRSPSPKRGQRMNSRVVSISLGTSSMIGGDGGGGLVSMIRCSSSHIL